MEALYGSWGDLELVAEEALRVRDPVTMMKGCRQRAQLDHTAVVHRPKGHGSEEAVLPSLCSYSKGKMPWCVRATFPFCVPLHHSSPCPRRRVPLWLPPIPRARALELADN